MVWLTFFCPVAEFPDSFAAGAETVDSSRPARSGDTLDIVCPCYNPNADFISHLACSLAELRGFYPDKRLHLIVANDGSSRNFGKEGA